MATQTLTAPVIADNFADDIPYSVAQAAHNGTSFVPERRANQEREGYAETLRSDYETFRKLAEAHGTLDLLDEQFASYRARCKRYTIEYLSSRSGLVSTMIAGGSNFPAARMNKRAESSHRKLERLVEFRQRACQAITRILNPGVRPIFSGDADAPERLQAKINNAERLQEAMKAGNKIVRSKKLNDDEKIAELIKLGLRESTAREALKPDFCGRIGFPDYALKNNNANIRRLQQRLEQVTRAKSTPDTETEGANARIEDCPSENRVRLYFPGKPEEATRDRLKRNGFRWTPSLGCWQAYRNHNASSIASTVAGVARHA
jgi:hypothetical protein